VGIWTHHTQFQIEISNPSAESLRQIGRKRPRWCNGSEGKTLRGQKIVHSFGRKELRHSEASRAYRISARFVQHGARAEGQSAPRRSPRIYDSRLRGNDTFTICDLTAGGEDMATRARPTPEFPQQVRQTCRGSILRSLGVSVACIRAKQSQSRRCRVGRGQGDVGQGCCTNKANWPARPEMGAGRGSHQWSCRLGLSRQTNPISESRPAVEMPVIPLFHHSSIPIFVVHPSQHWGCWRIDGVNLGSILSGDSIGQVQVERS